MSLLPLITLDHTLSQPLEGAWYRVLSLGAGVQSTTLALMAAEGLLNPAPSLAIFADTKSEPAGVYEHLARLVPVLPFPVKIVSAGSLHEALIASASAGVGARVNGRPPFFVQNANGSKGMTRRQCTQDYKILPITKALRELVGLRRGQRSPKDLVIEQWIGISTDEIQRMAKSRLPFVHHRWPLLELGMSRRDCVAWLASRGWSAPKSACTFCPYHSDAMWRDLRDNDPASWSQAVEVDGAIRGKLPDGAGWGSGLLLKGEPFLHRSCRPLDEVDLSSARERGQDDLFDPLGFANECEGMCGV